MKIHILRDGSVTEIQDSQVHQMVHDANVILHGTNLEFRVFEYGGIDHIDNTDYSRIAKYCDAGANEDQECSDDCANCTNCPSCVACVDAAGNPDGNCDYETCQISGLSIDCSSATHSCVFPDVCLDEDDMLRTVNNASYAVDVYFVLQFTDIGGESSWPNDGPQGIVIPVTASSAPWLNLGNVLVHELGHYFDLLHTFETAGGVECTAPDSTTTKNCCGGANVGDPCDRDSDCPGGSCGINCACTGDGFCDTPADPGLSGHVPGNICLGGPNDGHLCNSSTPNCFCVRDCTWDGMTCDGLSNRTGSPCNSNGDCSYGRCLTFPGPGDPCNNDGDCPPGDTCLVSGECTADATAVCGDEPYETDAHNIMSYSPRECRDYFSPQQIDHAVSAWLFYRYDELFWYDTYYLNSSASAGSFCGWPNAPCSLLANALYLAELDGTPDYFFLRSGVYDAPDGAISTPVLFKRWDEGSGTVVIR